MHDVQPDPAVVVESKASGTVPMTWNPRSRHSATAARFVSTTALNCIAA